MGAILSREGRGYVPRSGDALLPSPLAGEYLCSKSSLFTGQEAVMFRGPIAIFADEGIGENDKLAHDGGQSKLGLFAFRPKPVVEGLQIGIAARGRDGRHVQRLPDMGAAAFDPAQAPAVSGIIVEGSDASQGGDLSAAKQAELAQTGGERRGNSGPDALDRAENAIAALEHGIAVKQSRNSGLKPRNRPCASLNLAFKQPLKNLALSGGEPVLERGLIGFGGLPRQDQLLKLRHGLGRDSCSARAQAGAIERQKPGVDPVRLGQLPNRFGEFARAERIDNGNRIAGLAQKAVGQPVQLACRLYDHERRRQVRKHSAQLRDPFFAVGNAETLINRMQINIKPRFTDIDAYVNFGSGSYGWYLALHTGLAPQSSVQIMSRRADGPSSPASQKLVERTVPPARPMRDGHPSWDARITTAIRARQTCKGALLRAPRVNFKFVPRSSVPSPLGEKDRMRGDSTKTGLCAAATPRRPSRLGHPGQGRDFAGSPGCSRAKTDLPQARSQAQRAAWLCPRF